MRNADRRKLSFAYPRRYFALHKTPKYLLRTPQICESVRPQQGTPRNIAWRNEELRYKPYSLPLLLKLYAGNAKTLNYEHIDTRQLPNYEPH